MVKSLYITTTEAKSGKSAIVLGLMQLLLKNVRKVALFRPIIAQPSDAMRKDHDINLVLSHFEIDTPYDDCYAFTLNEARNLINKSGKEALFDQILKKFKNLESKYDFVLCEGTDCLGKDAPFEFELNADIADALGCPVLIVSNAHGKTLQEVQDTTQNTLDYMTGRTIEVTACIVNRSGLTPTEAATLAKALHADNSSGDVLLSYVLPEEPDLGRPTMNDVCKWLNGDILYGKKAMDTLVDDFLIAAMNVGNFMEYLDKGQVIITPGDREDIILASIASRLSSAYPDIAGIVLTGGIKLSSGVKRLLDGLAELSVPVISMNKNTSQCIDVLSRLYGRIEPHDSRKINTALGHFEKYVEQRQLAGRLVDMNVKKISPKMFEYNLIERAAARKMRIVLPEGAEERILRAADVLCRRNVAEIILLGDANAIAHKISELGLDLSPKIIQPGMSPKFQPYAEKYFELRKAKGISLEQAMDTMRDPTYFGTMMVHLDDADGMVSGSINTTAHTIRPAFEFIKTKPNTPIVSSVFLMCMKDRVLVFGDCAVNPNPTSEQLASIAISSARTAEVFGIEPRVAMLSYSTGASGKGADVDIVKEATRIAREQAPELLLEGPIQYDAAIDADVARTKLPESKVAGRATVFIFPDLNTGNNTYKAVQRAAGAVAIGPVLQGLNKPVNDLSRGCTVPDIVNTVVITALQAQAEKKA